MSDFVEHIREDGTIEMRNVRYDELIAVVHEPEPTPLTFTAEEIAEAYLNELRAERNRRIAETDWWANSDLTMTAEQTVYRQRLRNITDEFSSVESVEWPTLGQEVWPTPPFQPGT